ncbi:hypothetical protein WA026_004177 [Henosepilachna vigintioctopunctata]|uniref:C2H2-type domain-containing protein n=1 Tax=Henosepilachna vigintioctopunctata TaxID=420089 RepID=A0AAW1UF56_9CUCU
MEAFVESRKVGDLSSKDVRIVEGSIAAGNSHDYSGSNENCELEKQEGLLIPNGNNCIREAGVAFRAESASHDGSRMSSPSLLDVKMEIEDRNDSSLDSCGESILKKEFEHFNEEDETIWMKENEQFLLENRDTMQMDIDSFAADILHQNTEMMEDSNLIDVYCKYCEDNVISKSLMSHLNECHKDLKNIGKIQKHVHCRFCGNDIFSQNLMRHLERHHYEESDVQKILIHPKNSRERRRELSLFRNSTNFDIFVNGDVRPRQSVTGKYNSEKYFPCAHCKGVFSRKYVKNHRKFCYPKEERSKTKKKQEKGKLSTSSESRVECEEDYNTIISKLNVNNQVFHLMKQDLISLEAKRDVVIVHVGEHYLNNQNDTHVNHTVINKMRELSCLLIAYRSLVKEKN